MALAVAAKVSHLKPNRVLIEQAAFLHDIGIGQTDAPSLGCHGNQPYVCHGVFGRTIMEKQGQNRIAMICERHVGVGLTATEIQSRKLPLPQRDMLPVTVEEQIICYADKFFSKTGPGAHHKKSFNDIILGLAQFGNGQVSRFGKLHERFGM